MSALRGAEPSWYQNGESGETIIDSDITIDMSLISYFPTPPSNELCARNPIYSRQTEATCQHCHFRHRCRQPKLSEPRFSQKTTVTLDGERLNLHVRARWRLFGTPFDPSHG